MSVGMVVRGEQVDGRDVGGERDVRLGLHAIEQRGLDGPAGGVAGVDDARDRVRAFLGQIELALDRRGEGDVHLVEQQLP